MIDLALLRVVKYRAHYERVSRYIPMSAIDKKTKILVRDYAKYYEMHTEEESIDIPVFRSLFFTSWHKKLKDDDIKFYNSLITNIEKDVSDDAAKNLINQLIELELATDVGNAVMKYDEGEDIDIIPVLDGLVSSAQDRSQRSSECAYADFDDSTLEDEDHDNGMKWPLECMNDTYRSILGGDQYIVAARPGNGKTTFLTHLNTCMAQQMPMHKVIVWFNNESRRQRIMERQIHSALGVNSQVARELKAQGKLREEYIKAMGRKDRVRVFDIHGKNHTYLEEILEGIGVENVGAIVFDMLDNVKFPSLREQREDQRLESLYIWARELGVLYNCPTFPTSQVSNEGEGLLFPSQNMLKDSKTGKQGACDGIIMIGKADDPLREMYRGISMPKTKSKRPNKPALQAEVYFDEANGRYLDGQS